MSENEIAEALGVELDEAVGAEEQAVAEPAEAQALGDNVPEGEKEQPPSHSEAAEEAEEKPSQSAEERRQNAARRRENELEQVRKEAYERGRADHKAEMDKTLKELRTPDPTRKGKTIDTTEDLEAYRKAMRKSDMESGHLSEEALEDAISNHPTVKAAQAQLEAKAAEEAEKAKAAADAEMQRQVKEIAKYDSRIKSVGDLAAREGEEFRALLRRGFTFLEAYREVHFAEITAKEAEMQQRAAASAGKSHLTTNSGRGSGGEAVPESVMARYRQLNPEMTDEDIRKDYNQYLKDTKSGR